MLPPNPPNARNFTPPIANFEPNCSSAVAINDPGVVLTIIVVTASLASKSPFSLESRNILISLSEITNSSNDISIETIPLDETLSDHLATGEIDALLAPHIPDCFVEGHPDVIRLFPDFREVESDYYRRTGFFPIMHVVVMQRSIYEANPWAAAALHEAFCESKRLAHNRLKFSGAGSTMLPWLFAEVEQATELFGDEYWPYGVESNRAEIATMIRYARRQGITVADLTVDELFAPETLGLTAT